MYVLIRRIFITGPAIEKTWRFVFATTVSAAFLAMVPMAVSAQGQGLDSSNVQTDTNVGVTASPQNDARSQSGGNVFDFSNGGGRNTPPGPNLPSFAGGPCMGSSGGLSASGPGFAIGGGRSYEDEACQRRNWVQTLVGVSQHMPEVEANELKRVAIALMMQDEFLAPAFQALGYDTTQPGRMQRVAQQPAPQVSRAAPVQPSVTRAPVRAAMSENCVAVVPANATTQFRELVAARGCTIRVR